MTMKTVQGIVISDKMNKAAVVLIERQYRHPLYGKILRRRKRIHAVNELGAKVGQLVKVSKVRPISKTIAFKISEVISYQPARKSVTAVVAQNDSKNKKKRRPKEDKPK